MQAVNPRVRLKKSLKALPSADFKAIAQREIEQLDPKRLPLQEGLSHGSYVADEPFKAIIIGVTDSNDLIIVKAGIFYQSIIAGCNCADDPAPADTQQEYCVLKFQINPNTAEASVQLLEE